MLFIKVLKVIQYCVLSCGCNALITSASVVKWLGIGALVGRAGSFVGQVLLTACSAEQFCAGPRGSVARQLNVVSSFFMFQSWLFLPSCVVLL